MIDEYGYKKEIKGTVLEDLYRSNIFSVKKDEDNLGNIILTEACDHYYSISLTKEEMERLIQELIVLKDSI